MNYQEKVKVFKDLLEQEQRERHLKDCLKHEHLKHYTIEDSTRLHNVNVIVKQGKKYTKIDMAESGRYMIDSDGNIFGIKAYGVIHRGHQYGTLDTINDWYWGEYKAYKK